MRIWNHGRAHHHTTHLEYPTRLTVDRPEQHVLEVEYPSATECSVLIYVPGPWQPQLIAVAAPHIKSLGLNTLGQFLN
jgi:hypothetical protein